MITFAGKNPMKKFLNGVLLIFHIKSMLYVDCNTSRME